MGGIANQCETSVGPGGQWLVVVERPAERLVDLFQDGTDAGIPSFEFCAQRVGIAGCGPGFLHFFIGRHEAHIVDHLTVPDRKDQNVFGWARPHQPSVHRPVRQPVAMDKAAVTDGSVEYRARGRIDERAYFGMKPICGDDDIGFNLVPVGERYFGPVFVLLEADTKMPSIHDAFGQSRSKKLDHIGAMHAIRSIPTMCILHLDRCDRCSVMP